MLMFFDFISPLLSHTKSGEFGYVSLFIMFLIAAGSFIVRTFARRNKTIKNWLLKPNYDMVDIRFHILNFRLVTISFFSSKVHFVCFRFTESTVSNPIPIEKQGITGPDQNSECKNRNDKMCWMVPVSVFHGGSEGNRVSNICQQNVDRGAKNGLFRFW